MEEARVGAVPVATGLFTEPGEHPQLIASQCSACAHLEFPAAERCQNCSGDDLRRVLLSRTGTLYTWTSQGFRPPSPPYIGNTDFTPFAVGYVELAEGIRVEARLTEADPAKLRIGAPMELRLVPVRLGDDGSEVLTFAFAPMEAV